MAWIIPFDTTPFITASIEEVVKTLGEAMLLVTLVVFLFLQSWRATLIPLLAVPVSVIGTFLGLCALGFSINMLTLFALVLAIGIVVDDAIVVIENVERIMARGEGVGPGGRRQGDAAGERRADRDRAGALLRCSFRWPSSAASPAPCSRQFAVTIVMAVVLSGIVALTLTPALCALLLKETPHDTQNRFFRRFNDWFDRATSGYAGGVRRVLGRPRAWLAAFAVMLVLACRALPPRPERVPARPRTRGSSSSPSSFPTARRASGPTPSWRRSRASSGSEPAVRHVTALVGFDLLAQANQTERRHDVRAAQAVGASGAQVDSPRRHHAAG